MSEAQLYDWDPEFITAVHMHATAGGDMVHAALRADCTSALVPFDDDHGEATSPYGRLSMRLNCLTKLLI